MEVGEGGPQPELGLISQRGNKTEQRHVIISVNPSLAQTHTIDEEAVADQGIGAHLGDTVCQLAQLPVQLLSV